MSSGLACWEINLQLCLRQKGCDFIFKLLSFFIFVVHCYKVLPDWIWWSFLDCKMESLLVKQRSNKRFWTDESWGAVQVGGWTEQVEISGHRETQRLSRSDQIGAVLENKQAGGSLLSSEHIGCWWGGGGGWKLPCRQLRPEHKGVLPWCQTHMTTQTQEQNQESSMHKHTFALSLTSLLSKGWNTVIFFRSLSLLW